MHVTGPRTRPLLLGTCLLPATLVLLGVFMLLGAMPCASQRLSIDSLAAS